MVYTTHFRSACLIRINARATPLVVITGATQQLERESGEAAQRLRQEEAQLQDITRQIEQHQQQDLDHKQKAAALHQQLQRIKSDLSALGEQ
jgi:ATP-dependent Lon protease